MTDFQNNIINLMKSKFGPAATDFTNDILKKIGLNINSFGPESMEAFITGVEANAGTYLSDKDITVLVKELKAL